MIDKNNLEDITKLMKAGKVNTNGLENVQKMMSQIQCINYVINLLKTLIKD